MYTWKRRTSKIWPEGNHKGFARDGIFSSEFQPKDRSSCKNRGCVFAFLSCKGGMKHFHTYPPVTSRHSLASMPGQARQRQSYYQVPMKLLLLYYFMRSRSTPTPPPKKKSWKQKQVALTAWQHTDVWSIVLLKVICASASETKGKSMSLMHNFVNDSLVVIRMVFVCLFATSHFLILLLLFPLAATRCNMATRSAKTGTAKSVFGCNGKSATKWAVPWNIATETTAPTALLKTVDKMSTW